jgi:hypothetical protein
MVFIGTGYLALTNDKNNCSSDAQLKESDRLSVCGDPGITMFISFRGNMPRKSIYSGCTPCTLAAKVLPKGIIFANGFAFTGAKGYRVPLSIEPWNKSRPSVFA